MLVTLPCEAWLTLPHPNLGDFTSGLTLTRLPIFRGLTSGGTLGRAAAAAEPGGGEGGHP